MQALVEKIKTLQKSDESAKQQWWAYCDSKGNGTRDPSKHNVPFLKNFITTYESGAGFELSAYQNGDTSFQAMVAEVKRLQKSDTDFKGQWWAYCDAEGNGIHDPTKHDANFLQTFLANFHAGMRFESSLSFTEVLRPGATQDELIAHIKLLQRSKDDAKEAWSVFCEALAGGVRDPAKHDVSTLQQFVTSYHSGTKIEGAREPLAELFKEGQRRSDKWKKAWGEYCDSRGSGSRDPTKHNTKFLTEFFDAMGRNAAAAMGMGVQASAGSGMRTSSPSAPAKVNGGGIKRIAPAAKATAMGPAKKIKVEVSLAAGGGGAKDALVRRIKQFQRSGGQQQWGEYCDSTNNTVRDPSKHEVPFLKLFVQAYGVP